MKLLPQSNPMAADCPTILQCLSLSLPPVTFSNESSLMDLLKYTTTLITVLKNNQSGT